LGFGEGSEVETYVRYHGGYGRPPRLRTIRGTSVWTYYERKASETHVDSYAFAAETTRTTNSMNIVFTIAYLKQVSAQTLEWSYEKDIRRQVVVDDQ